MLGRASSIFSKRLLKSPVQRRFFGDMNIDAEEAAVRGKTWRNISLAALIPSAAVFLYVQFFEEEEEELELPKMPYKGVIYRRFPWVEGEKTIFAQLKEKHHGDHHHE